MVTSIFDPELVPTSVDVDDAMLHVRFRNGLAISTPISRFPRLRDASPEQRRIWRLIGKGDGIHWPEIDEDISVKGLFSGARRMPASSIEMVPHLIGELLKVTKSLNQLFPERPFTPDGHLVGSIGEVVAEYIYDLTLQPCSTPHVDAHTKDGRSVQIKLTGQNGTSYGMRWSAKEELRYPDLLLCMKLTTDGFAEVYNGPFPVDLLRDRPDQRNGQIALSVKRLLKRNPSLLPQSKDFTSINRWFTPQFSDVA